MAGTSPPPLRTLLINTDSSVNFNWGQFFIALWNQVQALPTSGGGGSGGANALPYSAITGTTTTIGTEQVIEATSGTFNLTLTNPTVATGKAFPLWICNSGTGVITILATTNLGSSFALAANSSVTLVFNGTNWLVF